LICKNDLLLSKISGFAYTMSNFAELFFLLFNISSAISSRPTASLCVILLFHKYFLIINLSQLMGKAFPGRAGFGLWQIPSLCGFGTQNAKGLVRQARGKTSSERIVPVATKSRLSHRLNRNRRYKAPGMERQKV
jgi:hypothetical protein